MSATPPVRLSASAAAPARSPARSAGVDVRPRRSGRRGRAAPAADVRPGARRPAPHRRHLRRHLVRGRPRLPLHPVLVPPEARGLPAGRPGRVVVAGAAAVALARAAGARLPPLQRHGLDRTGQLARPCSRRSTRPSATRCARCRPPSRRRPALACPLQEPRGGGAGRDGLRVVGLGRGQRLDGVLGLAAHPQRSAAGHEHGRRRAGHLQCRHLRSGGEQVLEGVEDQQLPPVLQRSRSAAAGCRRKVSRRLRATASRFVPDRVRGETGALRQLLLRQPGVLAQRRGERRRRPSACHVVE